ncbi:MAG: 50S ribosomal protein L6, partial [Candidatus Omnitrophica bacterium]|nr:50S ribosomal protein L6 [Candidatus Omnitrophota bacterium]MBD3268557.1 50S ribosomal protein L6 [Candidatus Omnitrophota bacterium]
MSRVGKQPIKIPEGIKIKTENNIVSVEGGKNKLQMPLPKGISLDIKEEMVSVKRAENTKQLKSLHGTMRVLINNMIVGTTKGFKKELEIKGVGYKTQMKGESIVLNIGFSHPVEMAIPEGLKVSTPSATRIVIEGIDKQKVGEFAAKIRRVY